eukprot:4092511-Amphidinium_carterae.1
MQRSYWLLLVAVYHASEANEQMSAHAALHMHDVAVPQRKKQHTGAMLMQRMQGFISTRGEGTGGLTPAEKAEVAEIRQILSMDIMPSLLAAAADAQ